jgi:hypothetical protein
MQMTDGTADSQSGQQQSPSASTSVGRQSRSEAPADSWFYFVIAPIALLEIILLCLWLWS